MDREESFKVIAGHLFIGFSPYNCDFEPYIIMASDIGEAEDIIRNQLNHPLWNVYPVSKTDHPQVLAV